ncbi:MAG: hypothetical protein WAK37_15560, partial [Pseudolabrys sp.]
MILRAYMGGRGGDAGEGAGGREGSARELGLQDEVEEEAEVVAIDVRFRGKADIRRTWSVARKPLKP